MDLLRGEENALDRILEREAEARAFALRVKPSHMMKRATFSHSATNIWQVQAVSNTTGRARAVHVAEPILWGSPCRIRHVSSGQYLAVAADDETGALVATTISDTPSSAAALAATTFCFVAVMDEVQDEGGAEVPLGHLAFARLRHRDTGRYLVLTDADVAAAASAAAAAPSLAAADDDGTGSVLSASQQARRAGPDDGSVVGGDGASEAGGTSLNGRRSQLASGAGGTSTWGGAGRSSVTGRAAANKLSALMHISLSPTASEKDVFGVQPLGLPDEHPDELRQLHRVQRGLAMLRRFERHLSQRHAERRPARPQPHGRAHSESTAVGREAAPLVTLSELKHAAADVVEPPEPGMCEDAAHALKDLACLVVGMNYDQRIDVFKIDETPKKRTQNLLRQQLAIEHLIKIIDLAWTHYFDQRADLVKRCRDAGSGLWTGPLGPLNEVCELCHAVLRSLVRGNPRCADQLQSIDAVNKLLDQLPTGWAPPVVEVFDALMRRGAGEGGYELYK